MTDETETQEETQEESTEGLTLTSMFDDSEETDETEVKADESKESEDEKGETETETEAKAEDKETDDESDEDKSKVETPSTEDVGLQAALTAERKKRQAAETKLAELKGDPEAPDPIDDPEGYRKHIQGMHDAAERKIRINTSRSVMVDLKDDFEEKEKVFMGLLGITTDDDGKVVDIENRSLYDQFSVNENPARFAYDHAVKHLLFEEITSPDYEKNLRKKIEAEMTEKLKKPKEDIDATEVPDLSTAAGSNSTKVETIPEVAEMFKDSPL